MGREGGMAVEMRWPLLCCVVLCCVVEFDGFCDGDVVGRCVEEKEGCFYVQWLLVGGVV